MRKITYRLVYNRKKKLNAQGTALLQVEAYLERRKIYFTTNIYLTPKQWNGRKQCIVLHPHAEALNRMVRDFMIKLESKELDLWKNGQEASFNLFKVTSCPFFHKSSSLDSNLIMKSLTILFNASACG